MNENLWMNGEKNYHTAEGCRDLFNTSFDLTDIRSEIGGDARATRTQLRVPKTNLVQPGDTVVPTNHVRDD